MKLITTDFGKVTPTPNNPDKLSKGELLIKFTSWVMPELPQVCRFNLQISTFSHSNISNTAFERTMTPDTKEFWDTYVVYALGQFWMGGGGEPWDKNEIDQLYETHKGGLEQTLKHPVEKHERN